MPPPENPHFAFPFVRQSTAHGGKVAVVEQDEQDHVMSCVNVIVRCPVGFRLERPDFGVAQLDYRTVVIPHGVMQMALTELEPRVQITTDVERDWSNLGDAIVTIEVETEMG
jgi:phage baseplate assembly protein W